MPNNDKFMDDLIDKIDNLKILSEKQILSMFLPQKSSSADQRALQEGLRIPPHITLRIRAMEIIGIYSSCNELCKHIEKIHNHISNFEAKIMKEEILGVNIFIGHGRSGAWRELKDFIKEKLRQPHDEFNRVPVAGIANITRLNQMLEQACFAFIVMTAEDETNEGKHQARMNVIHEVGLFQGKLGFERAIVVLEEGCEEFSNIHGLGQIRFPKGNIGATFQQIREVLEREGVIEGYC
ncbi:nucleotide-binding protein [Escherichia coli]|nr:nucleotide-binding protein [Escherichia coli]